MSTITPRIPDHMLERWAEDAKDPYKRTELLAILESQHATHAQALAFVEARKQAVAEMEAECSVLADNIQRLTEILRGFMA